MADIQIAQQTNLITHLIGRLRSDSLLRNSLFIMATNAFTSALGYFYWVVAARTYSPEAVGLVSAVISAMTLASLVCNLGFTPALFQTLPGRTNARDWSLTLNTAMIITSIVSLAGSFVVLLTFYFSPEFHDVLINPMFVAAFIVSVPLWTACNLLDAAFQAERASGNVLARNAAFAIVKLLILFVFVPLQIAGLGIFLSWVIGCAISAVIGFVLLRRAKQEYRFSGQGTLRHARSMVGSLIGHHFISIGGALPYYLLPIFVTARLSAEANAYFYTTWMLGTLFGMVSVSVAQSLFAEGAHADTPLLHSMNRSIRIILVLLAPLMALFILFGGFILGIFGEKYPAQGLTLLHVLTLATIPDAITSVYISILRVQERLREAAILNIIMAVIVLAFSWVFLPSMGIAAVGWGWFASQVAGTIIAGCDYFVTRRNRPQLWAERPKAVPDAITS